MCSLQTESKVSIIMPAYNAARTLKSSVESVINQTYNDWELIIIDDGSTDETGIIGKEYEESDERIILLSLYQNCGLSIARNRGVDKSTGYFIAFLDSDDIWLPDKLKMQIVYHRSNPKIGLSHTRYSYFDGENNILKRGWRRVIDMAFKKEKSIISTLYYKNTVGILTVMLKREIFLKVGGFDPLLKTFEDWDLWIRIAEIGVDFGYIPISLSLYRINPSGITNQTGLYKKSYKCFIKKYNKRFEERGIRNIVWGMYYRHFGTTYYKKGNYALSQFFFYKSLLMNKLIFINLTTLFYYILSCLKQAIPEKR